MTAPDQGGRLVTLTPGRGAVMITEYAGGADNPVRVINAAVTAGRVYLGADSSVSPSNGVPLDPGTALPWSSAGQLWAVADPAAAAPITLTVTAAIGDWTPSPAAIAAQVAAQLLATGVPNVLMSSIIAIGDAIGNGQSKTYDISAYAGIQVNLIPANAVGALDASLTQIGPDGVTATDTARVAAPGGAITTYNPIAWAVSGTTLKISNNSGGTLNVLLIEGSNRPPIRQFSMRRSSNNGVQVSAPFTAAGTVTVTQPGAVMLEGPTFLRAGFSGGSGTRGTVRVNSTVAGILTVMDAGDLAVSTATTAAGGKLINLPSGYYSLEAFITTFVANGTVTLDLIPAA